MGNVRPSEARTQALTDALRLLRLLRVGDRVTIIEPGGKVTQQTVQNELRSSDPYGGSATSARITIGYGPGRFNREYTAETIIPSEPPFYGGGYRIVTVDAE